MSDVRSSAPGLYGSERVVAGILTFATPSVVLEGLAVGDVVINAWCEVTTAFNALTTNVITLGNTATPEKFLATADVTEGAAGVSPVGGKGPFTAETVASNLVAAYAQTGTAATAGAARVYAVITSAPA